MDITIGIGFANAENARRIPCSNLREKTAKPFFYEDSKEESSYGFKMVGEISKPGKLTHSERFENIKAKLKEISLEKSKMIHKTELDLLHKKIEQMEETGSKYICAISLELLNRPVYLKSKEDIERIKGSEHTDITKSEIILKKQRFDATNIYSMLQKSPDHTIINPLTREPALDHTDYIEFDKKMYLEIDSHLSEMEYLLKKLGVELSVENEK